jgi:hypothetical protein
MAFIRCDKHGEVSPGHICPICYDEAQATATKVLGAVDVDLAGALAQAIRERDEARSDLGHCRQALSSLHIDLKRIANERDEAQADAAIMATWIFDQRYRLPSDVEAVVTRHLGS